MLANVRCAALGFFFVSLASGAIHAVIANCCSGSGTIIEIDATNFNIDGYVSTGAISTGTFSGTDKLVLAKGGRNAVVESTTFYSKVLVGPSLLTVVDLQTGTASQPLTLPDSSGPLAINPRTYTIYYNYGDQDGDSHIVKIDPSSLTIVDDVDIGPFACVGMVVAPDGTRIYLESEGSATAVLSTTELTSLGTLPFAGPVAVSPDSSTIYIANSSNIEVISATSLEPTASVPYSSYSNAVGLSPDGSSLYVATGDQQLCVMNTRTLALSCQSLSATVGAVTVSPNGTVYLSAESPFGEILVFDPSSQSVVGSHEFPNGGPVAVSPSGNQLYFSGYFAQMSSTGAVPSTDLVRVAATGVGVGQGAYDRADDLVLFGDEQGFVEEFDAATLLMKGIVQVPSDSYSVANTALLGYNGSGISISNQPFNGKSNGGVVRFDPVSMEITGEVGVPCSRYNTCLGAVSKGHAYVFFSPGYPSEACSGIEVVDTATMTVEGILPPPEYMPIAFRISPANEGIGYEVHYGEQYVGPSTVTQIDLTTGAVVNRGQLPIPSNPVAYLAISPDGSVIYVVLVIDPNDFIDGTLYALDAQTLQVTASADLDLYDFLDVTPDGQYLYSQTPGGIAIISTSTLQIVQTIPTTINAGSVVFVGN